jgi:hypothetical protein
LTRFEEYELSSILHSLKSYTAHKVTRCLVETGNSGGKNILTVISVTQIIFDKPLGTLKTIRLRPDSVDHQKIGRTVVLGSGNTENHSLDSVLAGRPRSDKPVIRVFASLSAGGTPAIRGRDPMFSFRFLKLQAGRFV